MKRLFIAIKIPVEESFKEKIENIQFHLKKENIKWVDLNNLHLTLQFLGDTEENHIPDIIDNLNKLQLQVKSFKFNLKGFGVFNNVYSPRVLWLGVEPIDKITVLKEMVDKNLINLDFKFKNENSFYPHLTIGRPKKIYNLNKLKTTLEYNKQTHFQQVMVNKVMLFESNLLPEGPIYTPLAEFNLR